MHLIKNKKAFVTFDMGFKGSAQSKIGQGIQFFPTKIFSEKSERKGQLSSLPLYHQPKFLPENLDKINTFPLLKSLHN